MSAKIKILIVEHDSNDIELLTYELKNSKMNYTAEIVQTETDYKNAINNFEPDIILSDYVLPSFDGPTAFKIREKIAQNTPFIFVSGTIGEEIAVELIKNGVTDYVLKDKLISLPSKINRALREVEEKKEKKNIDEKLKRAVRLYALISQVNQNILHVKDEATLFYNSCQMAIEFGRFKMAWIGMLDIINQKVTLTQHCGIPAEDSNLFINAPYHANDPQDYVLRTGKYYICNNIQEDLELEVSKPFAAKHGLQSCIVLPIKKSGKIIGTFNLYATEVNFSDKEEIKLLEELAEDISYALDLFEKEIQHTKAQDEIIASEERYRSLFNNMLDGFSYCKMIYKNGKPVDFVYIEVNDAFEKLTGLQNVTGKKVTEVIPGIKEESPQLFETYNRVALTGKPEKFEIYIKYIDMWLNISVYSNAKEYFIAVFDVITDRKNAEQQQEFDKNNLNALINNTKDLMWSIDTNFKLITFNEPFYNIIKFVTGKELEKGSSIFSPVLSTEQLDRFKISYLRAFAGEAFTEVEHIEMPVESWSEISYYPIRKGNEVIGTACHSRDIADRIKVEQQLTKSEVFNRGVIDSLDSHIAVIDHIGNIIAVNEAWKRFALENGETTLTRTREGSNYFEACIKSVKAGDTIAAEALQGIKDIMDEKKISFYLEYPCHSPNEQRWFAMRVMKFESDNQMVVVAHENITERKKAETERDHTQEANEELEKTKKELNNALAKEKDLNELKSRFVAMASHEFRTPLTTMMSSLSLVAKYNELSDKENQQKHVGKIKTSIDNLTGILNDFLSLSKLEEGKIENKPEAINLKNFITDIITEMRFMAEDRQKIVLNYSGNKIGIIDGKILKNVLHNLISNAIKFSPENGVIEVTAKSLKSSITISVKDNGIGIPGEDQKHLFERFFRGRNATHIQGTGLGLNIVTKYVEQLNGSISFDSKENQGTTFKITIPQ